MSDPDSKETNYGTTRPAYGEAPGHSLPNTEDRNTVAMLWFIIPCSLLVHIFGKYLPWLPWYKALGISCFVAALIAFKFRGPSLRHYGFFKYLGFYLLLSAGASIVAFAMDTIVSALFHR